MLYLGSRAVTTVVPSHCSLRRVRECWPAVATALAITETSRSLQHHNILYLAVHSLGAVEANQPYQGCKFHSPLSN